MQLQCSPGDKMTTGEPVRVGARPEHLELTKNGETKLWGEVFAVEHLGGETYLYVNNEKNEELTVHAAGDKVVGVGDLVSIGFSAKNCHLFNGQGMVFEKSED